MKALTLCLATALCGGSASYAAPQEPQYANDTANFIHPGILLDPQRLLFVRKEIAQGVSPRKEHFEKLLSDPLAARDYTPKAWATVECGAFSKPNNGCSDEIRDAQAAYTQALAWSYSGDIAYAENSIAIMNLWASTLTGGHTNTNGPLQASWATQLWTRTAEIIRYSYKGWADQDIQAFSTLLKTQYLPDVSRVTACHYGNWQASSIEARASIGIFTDDRELFDQALIDWRKRLPAFVYLTQDGELPAPPPDCTKTEAELIKYWEGQTTFSDGHAQETCRDLEHTAYGFAAFINVAETAYLQGIDLYGEQSERLQKGMEFHTKAKNAASVPPTLCNGKLAGDMTGTLEIAYNHYANRQGVVLPQTQEWLEKRRPSHGYFHYLWETLTHTNTGK